MRALALGAALFAAGCLGDTAGPHPLHRALLAVAPEFSARATEGVAFDRVRVTLYRGTSVALDTTVAFPATADSVALDLSVSISGASETLTLDLAMIDAAGDTVYRGGPVPVTVATNVGRPAPFAVPVRYAGVGANADSVRIAPRTAYLFFGDSIGLVAVAYDSANHPIPGTPIRWTSLDSTVARTRSDTTGTVVAGGARGVARVQAALLTGQTDTAHVTVQPVPVVLEVASGGAQTGPVKSPLARPVVVQLKAADSLGVAGIPVALAVTAGGGSVSPAVDTTDVNGKASVTWTLGSTVGTQTLSATVVGTPTLTTSVGATAVAGAAASLAFSAEPPASSVYQSAFAFTVTAKDSSGNVATGFTGTITVAIATNPAGGTLSGTLTQSAVAGVATFSGVSLDNIGSYTLSATATGLTAATSTALSIVAPGNVNAWINAAGGTWSTASNWSKGTVPVATDTVAIKQSGTYTVSLDVSGTFARLDAGGPLGTQTLSVAANTLTAGNGALAANTVLDLSGTGTITGAGTLTVAGTFNWTGGNLGGATGAGGAITVPAGGTLNMGPTSPATLQAWTLSLAGTGTWTGVDTISTGSGAILRVAAGGSLTMQGSPYLFWRLGGAAPALNVVGTFTKTGSALGGLLLPVNDSGTVNVPGFLVIAVGGTNTFGGNSTGTIAIPSGGLLVFNGGIDTLTSSSSVSGAGLFVVAGGTVVIRGSYVAGTAVQGGTLAFANATGPVPGLNLSGGTVSDSGNLTVSGAVTADSGVTIAVTGGRLKLAGGSVTAFGANITVNAGDTLDLAGGTFTLTRALTATGTGALVVSGGSLVLNGYAAAVPGDFATLGAGALTMTNAKDSLGVGGSTTFGGGASTLSGGVMGLAGNFTQSGAASSFAPTGTFVTLGGAATQTLSFTDATNSFFRRLTINKTAGGVVLATNVRASFFRLASATAVTGPAARLFTDTISSPLSGAGPSITPLAVEITSVLSDSAAAAFSPDTTVFTGTDQVIPLSLTSPFAYKSVRVAQTATGIAVLGGSISLPNDLVVSSGGLQLSGPSVTVAGNFLTQGTGYLVMASTPDSLKVAGNVTFGGGSTAGTLTNGVITVGGNFAQAGDTSAYVPRIGSAHRLVLNGTGAQSISFANPTTSWFNVLDVASSGTRTVTLQTNVLVSDTLYVDGGAASTTIVGAGTSQRLQVTGILDATLSTVSPVVRPPVLELFATPLVGAAPVTVSPDTMVLNGGIASLPTGSGIVYNSVRVNTTGALLAPSGNVTFHGNLVVSAGTYSTGSGIDSVQGFLRTEGSGALSMTAVSAVPTVVVRDSAVFGGGASTTLTGGLLQVGGSFVQRGTATSFAAGTGHTTLFPGSGTQTVTFANPGTAASTFGNLAVERAGGSAGITLGSNIFVAGQLQDSTTGVVTDSIFGNGFTVTAGGLGLGSVFVLNDAPLVTNGGTLTLGALTFRNMPPAATQWTMNLAPNANGYILTGLNFAPTTFTGGGQYFAALLNATGVATNLTVTSALPVAATLSGHYTRTNVNGSVTVIWNGTTNP